ncbi:MAG: cyanophycinase [Acidobacteriia bacterium]|nr:cyanophycinase [Terriglobia bacterium]
MRRYRRFLRLVLAGLLLEVFLLLSSSFAADPHYKYFRAGNPADIQTKTQAGVALMGGGDDLDPAFKWMCERSGGGDFLILRAHGDDEYNPYIQGICKVNSVATLVMPDRAAAEDPFAAAAIRNAEAVFIAGGDQANYINFWMGTPVQQALNDALARNVPIGGTSAGLAVQGEFIYSAQADPPDGPDLSSPETLANPFHPRVTIVHQFLNNPLLKEVITDTHFSARDRLGRTLVFMARILQDGKARHIRDMAIDERTAVLLEPGGMATVVGAGSAYFLQASQNPETCKANTPLTFRGVAVRSLHADERFNVSQWSSNEGISYTLSVESGVIYSSLPDGAVYTTKSK